MEQSPAMLRSFPGLGFSDGEPLEEDSTFEVDSGTGLVGSGVTRLEDELSEACVAVDCTVGVKAGSVGLFSTVVNLLSSLPGFWVDSAACLVVAVGDVA